MHVYISHIFIDLQLSRVVSNPGLAIIRHYNPQKRFVGVCDVGFLIFTWFYLPHLHRLPLIFSFHYFFLSGTSLFSLSLHLALYFLLSIHLCRLHSLLLWFCLNFLSIDRVV